MPTGLEQGNKRVDDGLKTLITWSKTFDKPNTSPLIDLFMDIRVPSAEKNIMTFGGYTREKLLAMFFDPSRNVRDPPGTCDEYFQSYYLP